MPRSCRPRQRLGVGTFAMFLPKRAVRRGVSEGAKRLTYGGASGKLRVCGLGQRRSVPDQMPLCGPLRSCRRSPHRRRLEQGVLILPPATRPLMAPSKNPARPNRRRSPSLAEREGKSAMELRAPPSGRTARATMRRRRFRLDSCGLEGHVDGLEPRAPWAVTAVAEGRRCADDRDVAGSVSALIDGAGIAIIDAHSR